MKKETFSPTMFTEDDFIQISALQHYVFCPRQCALIHIEDAWQENVFTVRGNILHDKVHTDTFETRGTLKTVRGLRIHSARLGLVGRCDVVEFHSESNSSGATEAIPVEFKAGQPKEDESDKMQLCAQALCLEEMLNTPVKRGAFFYGRIRRRVEVKLDGALRSQTESIIASVRELVANKRVPTARYMPKCKHCSIFDICQPKAMNERKLKQYIQELYVQNSQGR